MEMKNQNDFEEVGEKTPIYNSRIIKVYSEYVSKYYPDIDFDSILDSAGVSRYELEDPAHWFTQEQVDRMQKSLAGQTGNPHISREAGRYAASSEALGAAKGHLESLQELVQERSAP